jgi:hypothetical protein
VHRRLLAFVLLVSILAIAVPAHAQSWSFRLSGNMYFLPDEENYLQPTFAADRDALHLESRYRYEDDRSVSFLAGWNLEFGDTFKLVLTPMFGGVTGRTTGIVPALEGHIAWKRLEFYSEGEWVVNVGDTTNSFFYNWSELSVWTTEWLRAGVVTQRTRAYSSPRDIQRGLLVGAAGSKVEGTLYFFSPGSVDWFVVGSIGVTF